MFGGNLLELCPLDKTHYVRKRMMKQHLLECKKQFLKSPRKVECPFNPLHIISLMEIEQHIMTCENRVVVLNSLYDFEPKRETIDGVKMEPINQMPVFPTYWDNEEHPESGYDAMEMTKFRAILKPTPPGLSKKQKKEFKAKERQRWKWLVGETRHKPYTKPTGHKANEKSDVKPMTAEDEAKVMQSIIDGLSGADIGDPRDAMLKRINTRLKALKAMEAKVTEEKLALQKQVQEYVAMNAKKNNNGPTSADPRIAALQISADLRKATDSPMNIDLSSPPCIDIADHASRILSDLPSPMMSLTRA